MQNKLQELTDRLYQEGLSKGKEEGEKLLFEAKAQADEYGHSFLREICFLAVHGFYHLLGYDHMTEDDEKVMFAKQEEVLNSYGITR